MGGPLWAVIRPKKVRAAKREQRAAAAGVAPCRARARRFLLSSEGTPAASIFHPLLPRSPGRGWLCGMQASTLADETTYPPTPTLLLAQPRTPQNTADRSAGVVALTAVAAAAPSTRGGGARSGPSFSWSTQRIHDLEAEIDRIKAAARVRERDGTGRGERPAPNCFGSTLHSHLPLASLTKNTHRTSMPKCCGNAPPPMKPPPPGTPWSSGRPS